MEDELAVLDLKAVEGAVVDQSVHQIGVWHLHDLLGDSLIDLAVFQAELRVIDKMGSGLAAARGHADTNVLDGSAVGALQMALKMADDNDRVQMGHALGHKGVVEVHAVRDLALDVSRLQSGVRQVDGTAHGFLVDAVSGNDLAVLLGVGPVTAKAV